MKSPKYLQNDEEPLLLPEKTISSKSGRTFLNMRFGFVA